MQIIGLTDRIFPVCGFVMHTKSHISRQWKKEYVYSSSVTIVIFLELFSILCSIYWK